MAKKLSKWERERAANKQRARKKAAAVKRASDVVESLWKSAQERDSDGKRVFTENECEAIADASYSLRSVLSGWINNKRR